MLLILTTAAGACLWLITWAITGHGFDAILIPLVMVIIAATITILIPTLPGNRARARAVDDAE
jgi:hypothetical protein